MSRDAHSPGEEFKIAAAGPLATFGFVLLCLAVDLAIVGPHRLVHAAELDNTVKITPVLLSLSWLLFDERAAAGLQPRAGVPARRRPDRARDRLARRPATRRRGTRVAAKLGQGFAVLLAAGIGVLVMLDYRNLVGAVAGRDRVPDLPVGARRRSCRRALTERIEGVRVADIMDRQPVAIPAQTAVAQALDEFFLRYGWSWFPVIDDDGRFLGIARQERLQRRTTGRGLADGRMRWSSPSTAAAGASTRTGRSPRCSPRRSLGRLGALMAVDGEGVLRGVVTVEQVRRALQAAFGSPGRLA